ncbi:MAG: hypothetical protein EXR09_05785, partial [Acetobacteraceae bacterium]|nr:hypothetical protein [Acetobacteraceae bacterium]
MMATSTAGWARSPLPPCPADQKLLWTNCFGTQTYASGIKYVGEWRDNKPNGQGIYTWSDGNKYVGELRDNKFHGQGTFTWSDGNKYVGEWRD